MNDPFDPTDYPRRYRLRLRLRLFLSIMFLVVLFGPVKTLVVGLIRPGPSLAVAVAAVMCAIFLPVFVWFFVMAWRGTLGLYPDRLVYGFWLRERTIRREGLEGFRISEKPSQILVLLMKNEARRAVTIPVQQLGLDQAFWRWFETLDDKLIAEKNT